MRGVAFSGKAGSGKSTVAGMLSDVVQPRGMIASFGAAVKADCLRDWGVAKEMPGGREALIRYGEERRQEDDYHWIDRLAPTIEGLRAGGYTPVVDDVRFSCEFDWLQDEGFVIVRLYCPVEARRERVIARGDDPAIVDSSDITECQLDHFDFDYGMHTLGSQYEVYRRVLRLAASLPQFVAAA